MGIQLEAALTAAERGWRVLPLKPGTKIPAVKRWEDKATTDPDIIRTCWTTGNWGVGIAAGPSGLVVIDLDVLKPWESCPTRPNGGLDTFTELLAEVGEQMPDTYTVTTPSGGSHLYFTAPEWSHITNSKSTTLGWKVDVRGWGGQVVAAGQSLGTSHGGRPYAVTTPHDPAPLPPWLLDRLTRPSRTSSPPNLAVQLDGGATQRGQWLQSAVDGEVRRVGNAAVNDRNWSLYVAARSLGQLVAGGDLAEWEVTAVLLGAAARHIEVGAYDLPQARRTIASGLAAGAKRPRRLAA